MSTSWPNLSLSPEPYNFDLRVLVDSSPVWIEARPPQLDSGLLRAWKRSLPQRLQYPSIKEYTLNYSRDPTIIKVYSLIKGYWSLWVLGVMTLLDPSG